MKNCQGFHLRPAARPAPALKSRYWQLFSEKTKILVSRFYRLYIPWHYVCWFSRQNLAKISWKKFGIFFVFSRNLCRDFFLKIGIHSANVCRILPAGSVWARPDPVPADGSATVLIAFTHWLISSSSEAWKRDSPPLESLKLNFSWICFHF